MSLTRSPLRSALLPALWPPTAQRPRGGGAPPPSEWTPIQQVDGWSIVYDAPLGDNIVDNGTAWVATNHAVVGLDASLYFVAFQVHAPTMPASFPLRARFVSFEDTIATPGVNLVLPTAFGISDNVSSDVFPNPEPPTSSFAGSPFEKTIVPIPSGDGEPAFAAVHVQLWPPTLNDSGPDTLLNAEYVIEVQNTEGEWQLMQDAPGTITKYDIITQNPTTFQLIDLLISQPGVTMGDIQYLESVYREIIPIRVTMLSYVVTPDPVEPGTFNTPATLRINADGESETSFDGEMVHPATDFPGGPFTVEQPAYTMPGVPPSSYRFGINGNDAAYENSVDTGQTFSFELVVEVQLPP